MRKFTVEIPHSLPTDEVRARLDKAKAKLEADYGASCSWEGDALMRVSRKGLDGKVAIEPDKLRVDVELGLIMSAMSTQVRDGIVKRLTTLMA